MLPASRLINASMISIIERERKADRARTMVEKQVLKMMMMVVRVGLRVC